MRNCPLDLTPDETLVESNSCGFLGFAVNDRMHGLNAAAPLL